ncbi:MAG: hypothetical protein D6744_03120 [Planctomycetota bacterium]|nr:MAG: hypothetical protein D6744_03120 [Planctomycetota bacterium]
MAFGVVSCTAAALAGGTGEHALLLVDPSRPDAKHLANYYRAARDIPDVNVLYMKPTAANYTAFVNDNLDAFFGYMAQTGIRDHVDFVVIMPPDSFYVSAPGLIGSIGCPAAVSRFSISGAYTMSQIVDDILGGGLVETSPNRYFRANNVTRGFDSETLYFNGKPSTDPGARAYFIGALLGWTGTLGNTVGELTAMIDRSVAVDGTFPAGTFYYMETADTVRSGVRDADYPARVADIISFGGMAEHLFDNVPVGRHDALGIMTGIANPGILTEDFSILPGAICDHLTSWAATFDRSSQEKVSAWIAKGASGSWGTVEEPCAIAEKFPNARVHVWYFRGMTLGESLFRAAKGLPFQGLLYGDPLTRPFTHIPVVSVPDAPTGTVSGTITLTPSATTSHPTGAIDHYELLVDGVLVDTVAFGGQFNLDTAAFGDGWHDLRVLAVDDTLAASSGRWVGSFESSNHGHAITISPTITSGDLATAFTFAVTASGPDIQEVRLIHNGRVIDASASLSPTLSAYGSTLGAGPARVQAEALLSGGRRVRTAPVVLDISTAMGTPSGAAPVARSYRKHIRGDTTAVVELPYDHDNDAESLTFQVLSGPSQATLAGGTDAYRIVRPMAGASGEDTFTFQVSSASGTSGVATVTLVYTPCQSDIDGDGVVGLTDLAVLLSNFETGTTREEGDINGDGTVDLTDLAMLLSAFDVPCP